MRIKTECLSFYRNLSLLEGGITKGKRMVQLKRRIMSIVKKSVNRASLLVEIATTTKVMAEKRNGFQGTTNKSVDVTIGTEISVMTRTVDDLENERDSEMAFILMEWINDAVMITLIATI